MIPELKYYRPKTVEEALNLLEDSNGEVKLIAGGTDIIPGFQQASKRFVGIKTLIDTKSIKDLSRIESEKEFVTIGTACTFSQIQNNQQVEKFFPLLTKAASTVGSLQIRNLATVTGNFVNNAPCADSVAPLLVYNAKIEIQSKTGVKETALEDFLITPYKIQLQSGEIVTKIIIPKPSPKAKGEFYKLGRRRGVAISRITLAVLAEIKNKVIKDIRIASGAVTPIGKRFRELEKAVTNKTVSDELLKEMSIEMGNQILNDTGLRWSTAYKLPVVQQKLYHLLIEICRN
jgi:CO/xanthine dehydrogenase FAD-binding subunit